ncbi:MAG: PD-(D/E)XK nuclease family protein [Flavobacteriaceae bacterium]
MFHRVFLFLVFMATSFLDYIVKSVSGHRLEKLCFVVPNRRATLYLNQAISKTLSQPCIGPQVFDIDAFVREVSGVEVPPKMELIFSLYQSYCPAVDKQKRDDFSLFLGWGETLLNDLDAIDRNLIDRKGIFAYLSSLYQLKSWAKEESSLVKNYLGFWDVLPEIYENFITTLTSKGHGTSGKAYREAVASFEAYIEAQPDTHFVFCGFNALSHSESHLFQSALAQERATVFWDIDRFFLEDKTQRSAHFIAGYKQKWPFFEKNNFLGIHESFSQPKQIEVIETAGVLGQAKQVGTILQELSKNKPEWERVAVVLPDESLLEPVLHALPSEIERLNVTMGQPLKGHSLSALFEAVFDLQLGRSLDKGFYHKHLEQLLGHPVMAHLSQHHKLADPTQIMAELVKRNQSFITSEALFKLHPFAHQLEYILTTWNTPQQAVSSLLRLVDEIRPVVEQFAPDQQEILYRFYTLFNQLDQQISKYSFVSDLRTLRTIYTVQIATQKLSYEGTPLEGLQIMGMLETRLIDFDTVILTQASEGILPSMSIDDSWMPYDVKKKHGIPTRDEKEAIYAYHFFRLMYRAKQVFILYTTNGDVLGGGEISRFVRQWKHHLPATHKMQFFTQQQTTQLPKPEPQILTKTAGVLKRLKELAQSGFSPTALGTYIRNPIQFYDQYLLQIEEAEEVEESIAANTLGTVAHDCLETLYKPFEGKELSVSSIESIQSQLEPTLSKKFVSHFGTTGHSTGKNLLLFTAAKHNLNRALDADKQLIQSGTTIQLIGVELQKKITRNFEGVPFPICFKGVVDRVDRVDGQLRILDYKTGTTEPRELLCDDIASLSEDPKYSKAFQVLFYSMLFADQLESNASFTAGIYSIKKPSNGFMPFGIKGSGRSKRIELTTADLKAFEEMLARLVREVFHPEVAFVEPS